MDTIQDVAKYAHVGVGTVSRVLTGKGYVKEETRKRVLEAIEKLNYTPNQMARNLFYSKTGIVAVIVPEIGHPFFTQFVSAVEVALWDKGYQAMVCNTYYEKNYELRCLELLKQKRVDGIIFGSHTTQDISRYQGIHRPIVALDRDLGDGIPCVLADHKTGGRLAAEELIRSGCKNVVLFGSPKSEDKVMTPSSVRYEVFAQTLEEHGVAYQAFVEHWPTADITFYQNAAKELLDQQPNIDGVFATDMMIMAVLQAALAQGKQVPKDLKLVAYDGTNSIGFAHPRITAVVQPITQLAEKAAQLVVDQIEGKPTEETWVEIPVSLFRGETTMRE